MLKLSRQKHFFFSATALCIAVLIIVLTLQPSAWKLYAGIALFLSLISIMLMGKVSRASKVARLIIENQILNIQPVVFKKQSYNNALRYRPYNSIEVFISCFGILLGSKIFKFNQSEVSLRAVELDPNYITLTYGTDRRIQITKFLHTELSYDEITEITYKFQYETGIIPVVNTNGS